MAVHVEISRSKSKLMVFIKYKINETYFVCTIRSKNVFHNSLHLPCKLFENRLKTHRDKAPDYMPINDNFVVFWRLMTNDAYFYISQRTKKDRWNNIKISWTFHDCKLFHIWVMALAFLAFFAFSIVFIEILNGKKLYYLTDLTKLFKVIYPIMALQYFKNQL